MDNSPPPPPFHVLQVPAKIMLLSVIVLFIVVTIALILHIYARWRWSSSNSNTEDPFIVAWRRRQFAFITTGNDSHHSSSRANRRGLDTKSLESLPIIQFNPKDHDKEGLECSVCLSEVGAGEKMRVLPNCNHGFHVDCIDMWFHSHSTCPLCRNPVMMVVKGAGNENGGAIYLRSDDEDGSRSLRRGFSAESSGFPTNVLTWANETQQVSSLGGGQEQQVVDVTSSSSIPSDVVRNGGGCRRGRESLVIDIPKRVLPTEINCSPMGVISSSSSTHHDGEDMKSPSTPMSTRLKRLLSRGKKVAAVPSAYGSSSTSSSSEYAIDVHRHQVEQV